MTLKAGGSSTFPVGEGRGGKFQAPNPRPLRLRERSERSPARLGHLVFGVWSFFGTWSLGLGASLTPGVWRLVFFLVFGIGSFGRVASAAPEARDHWAWQPLVKPALPPIPSPENRKSQFVNPIDAFLRAELKERRLTPSPEADRRTLIRRLIFDLHGLPPTPEEVDAFVADRQPRAYERLVDRLLASPRYGERWARHWLDVAHYGESDGFGMDRPRLAAWPYRDYVIASFNADKSYARFVQEQLAADALFPDEPALTPALGFAAAGPFNQSALVEQVDGTLCKRIALNLDRDDMVASTASTFLSLTVHCARCHDHKFDPITQRDYYRLQAVFAGVGRAERMFDADPALHAKRAELRNRKASLEKNPEADPPGAEELAALQTAQPAWEQSLIALVARWSPVEMVHVSTKSSNGFTRLPDGSWLATGIAAPQDTYKIEARVRLPRVTALRLEVLPDDSLPKKGPGRTEHGNFLLSEARVGVAPNAGAAPGGITWLKLHSPSADFSQKSCDVALSIDGKTNTGWAVSPEFGQPHEAVFEIKEAPALGDKSVLVVELDQFFGTEHLFGRFRLSATDAPSPVRVPEPATRALLLDREFAAALAKPAAERTDAEQRRLFTTHRLRFVTAQLAALPPQQPVWSIASDFAKRNNYGPVQEPRPIHVLRRGDVQSPLAEAPPGAVELVRALRPEFELDNPRDEAARRAALARWITAPENMLAWRSIVNRVWHWHFGRGLVDTPNDFGKMGSPPTHPELLDWLAVEFRDSGGSLKRLHKLLVTSAAYRQVSTHRAAAARVDSDNRFLWRMNRARLDAESVRDALLAASGKLDLTMGGPSAMQFKFDDPDKTLVPRLDYAAFDPDSPASFRRGVYRFLFRNVNDPLLEAFDACDPSLSTPKRNTTVTPLQSLSLWNNRFVLRQCEHLAARLERDGSSTKSQIERAFRLLCARPPTASEAALLADHVREHGLASACRVLVNSNDFLFVN